MSHIVHSIPDNISLKISSDSNRSPGTSRVVLAQSRDMLNKQFNSLESYFETYWIKTVSFFAAFHTTTAGSGISDMGTLAIENSCHTPTFCKNRWFCWSPDVSELKLSSRPKTSIKSRLVDIAGKISFILGKMTSEGLSNDFKFCINIVFFRFLDFKLLLKFEIMTCIH